MGQIKIKTNIFIKLVLILIINILRINAGGNDQLSMPEPTKPFKDNFPVTDLEFDTNNFGKAVGVTSAILLDDSIIIGSDDRTLKRVDINKLLGEYKGHTNLVNCVAVQGDKVVSGSWDNTVRIWDLNTYKQLQLLEGHGACVTGVAIVQNRIVSSSWDKTIRVWDLNNGEVIHKIKEDSWIYSLAVTNNKIIAGLKNGIIKIYDLNSYKQLAELKGHKGAVSSIFIEADTMVTGSEEKIITWDLKTYSQKLNFGNNKSFISSVAILGGNRVICGSVDNFIRIYDLENGKELYRISDPENKDPIGIFSNRDKAILFYGKKIRVWRYNSEPKEIAKEEFKEEYKEEYKNNAQEKSWKLVHKINHFERKQNSPKNWPFICPLKIAVIDNKIISGYSDGVIRVWNFESGKLKLLLELQFDDLVNSICIVGDEVVVAGSSQVIAFNIQNSNKRIIRKFKKEGIIHSIKATKNKITVFFTDLFLQVLDFHSGETIENGQEIWEDHDESITAKLALKNYIITGFKNGTIKIVHLRSGKIDELDHGDSPISSIIAINDSIVSGADDGTIKVWSNQEITTSLMQGIAFDLHLEELDGTENEEPDLQGETNKCHFCGKLENKDNKLQRCSKCKLTFYCSKECQEKDWKAHKVSCKK